MIKKRFFVTVCVIMIIAMLAACSPAATEQAATEAPATSEETAATETTSAALKVAVVAGGEIGDMGFIDSASAGLDRMTSELGLETMIITNHDDNNNNLDILLSAAEEADLIFVVPGYFFDEQLKEVVPQFPDKTFIYVDGATSIEGMDSVVFLQNEGAFLAGALAALMTTDTEALANADAAATVGFMGGADMPVIHDYQVGFDQGAKYAVEDVTVIDQYAGTHYDAAIGKETALAMYGNGADIIFQAAGPTGLGLFEAAKEAQKYAIGVDTNQKGLAPEWVLASMRKNVGDSIFQFTQAFIAGEVTTGTVKEYGLAENGVGIDYGDMDPDLVPQEVKDKVAEYAQMIIDGEIVVDTYTAEAATEESTTETPAIKVAVVAGGEIGDMGFIDSASAGLDRMASELGLETMIITNHDDNNNNLDILLSAAEEADLIFVVPGYFFDEQLKEVVPQFPDKTFIYVDGATSIEGMDSVVFLQNEGAFLAGALAALMTTDTEALANADAAATVGFMGGADMPVIHDYQVGFDQGAKYAVNDVTVIDQYAGTHYDAAIGKETALAMYGNGADIIFQAAGPTGLGLFEAAKEAQKYAIGVDTNQKGLAPEWVLASMRKNVGDSIFQFTQAFIAGEVTTGTVKEYGLAENGVGIDYGDMDPDLVPQEVKDKVAEYAQMIIDGEIVVDTYTAE